MSIKIGIVDDHQLFVESLQTLLMSYEGFEVTIKAFNGLDLQKKLKKNVDLPDIMLVDVNMPKMDGIETTIWLRQNYPNIKIAALSMKDDERTIIKMLKAGCCSYLLKDIHPDELGVALLAIKKNGFYNGDVIKLNYNKLFSTNEEMKSLRITENEQVFLKLACSELSYKEIADIMNLSERTVEGYRSNLFLKLNVSTRIGLALEAIRRKLVDL